MKNEEGEGSPTVPLTIKQPLVIEGQSSGLCYARFVCGCVFHVAELVQTLVFNPIFLHWHKNLLSSCF